MHVAQSWPWPPCISKCMYIWICAHSAEHTAQSVQMNMSDADGALLQTAGVLIDDASTTFIAQKVSCASLPLALERALPSRTTVMACYAAYDFL